MSGFFHPTPAGRDRFPAAQRNFAGVPGLPRPARTRPATMTMRTIAARPNARSVHLGHIPSVKPEEGMGLSSYTVNLTLN
jgi:hypothetical protein